jgi:hypothetical protein
MSDDCINELYERNQELIEEMWEDLTEDEMEVERIVFNHDPFSYPFPL